MRSSEDLVFIDDIKGYMFTRVHVGRKRIGELPMLQKNPKQNNKQTTHNRAITLACCLSIVS